MEQVPLIALGLPLRELEADIHDIAWGWEIIMENSTQDVKQARIVLLFLVRAYLRGRGYRMGNYQGTVKHLWKVTALCAEVIKEVIEQGPIIYKALHTLGFKAFESVLELLAEKPDVDQNIIDEANRILREKQL